MPGQNHEPDERERKLPGWLAFLADLQARRPWLLVAIAVLSLLPAGLAANQLFHDLRMDFSELLPDNKPSVIEMRRVSKRLAGSSTLSIAISTSTPGKQRELEAFVDALVPELYGLGPEWVGAVDYGVKDARTFFGSGRSAIESFYYHPSQPDGKGASCQRAAAERGISGLGSSISGPVRTASAWAGSRRGTWSPPTHASTV